MKTKGVQSSVQIRVASSVAMMLALPLSCMGDRGGTTGDDSVTFGAGEDATRAGTLLTSPPSVAAPALRAPEAVGALKGRSGVTEQGTFTYRLPIDVPKGRAGMEPELALSYDSGGGNGLLGMGWSLSGGASFITRCAKSWAAGRKTDRVFFSSTDRFCLDGQRLLVVNGTYGAEGSEYRTEMDTFAKIVLVRNVSPGGGITEPGEFKVYFKNGRIGTYLRPTTTNRAFGYAADGSFGGTGEVTMSWPMYKLVDRANNAIRYTYEERQDALPVLTRIEYTACDSGTCDYPSARLRRVDLVPEDRAAKDIQERYISGARFRLTRRLKEVVVSVASGSGATATFDPIQRYVMRYGQGGITGRTQLRGIKKCDESSPRVCLPETTFAWNGESPGGFTITPFATTIRAPLPNLTAHPEEKRPQLLPDNGFAVFDVNGDGNDDVVFKSWPTDFFSMSTISAPVDKVALSDGHSYFAAPVNIDPDGNNAVKTGCPDAEVMDPGNAQVVDLDGDGRLEWVVALNTGCATVDVSSTTPNYVRVQPGSSSAFTTVGAQNRTIGTMAWHQGLQRLTKVDMSSTSNGFDARSWVNQETKLADMNGDGIPDQLIGNFGDPSGWWRLMLGSKTTRAIPSDPRVSYGSVTVAKMSVEPSQANPYFRPSSFQITDEDGDGRAELLQIDHLGSRRSFFFSPDVTQLFYRYRRVENDQAVSLQQVAAATNLLDPSKPLPPNWPAPDFGEFSIGNKGRWYAIDVNGDGLKDVLYRFNSGWELRINTGAGYGPPQSPGTEVGTMLASYSFDTEVTLPTGSPFNRGVDTGVRAVDLNGDGRQDLVLLDPQPNFATPLMHAAGYHTASARVRVAYSNGAGFDAPVEIEDGPGVSRIYLRKKMFTTQFGDINGDGLPEMIDMVAVNGDPSKRQLMVWRRQNAEGGLDVIYSVSDESGAAANVRYDHMSAGTAKRFNSSTVTDTHVSDLVANSPTAACNYPAACVSRGIVVRQFEDLRSPRKVQSTFSYRGAREDRAGRGFLGFTRVIERDFVSNFVTTKSFTFIPIEGTVAGDNGPGYHLYGQRSVPQTTVTEFDSTAGPPAGLNPPSNWHLTNLTEVHTTTGYPARQATVTRLTTIYEMQQTNDRRRRRYSTTINYDAFGNPQEQVTQDSTLGSGIVSESRRTITTMFDNTASTWLIGLARSRTDIAKTLEDTFGTGCVGTESVPCSTSTRKTTYDYYPNGLLQRINREPDASGTSGLRVTQEFIRNAAGLVTSTNIIPSETGATTRTERTVFDESGANVIETSNAAGHKTFFLYQPKTKWLYGVADQNGPTNKVDRLITHDTFGRVREVATADGAVETTNYGVRTIRKAIADGPGTVVYFDRQERPIIEAWSTFSTTGSAGTVTTYNDFGHPTKTVYKDTTLSLASLTSSESNALNQLTSGGVQQAAFTYDAMGRVVGAMKGDTEATRETIGYGYGTPIGTVDEVDALGNSRRTFTDHRGNVRSLRQLLPVPGATQPRELFTSYGYDAQGLLTHVRTPDGARELMSHDRLGRLNERRQYTTGGGTNILNRRLTYTSFDETSAQYHGGSSTGTTAVTFVRDVLGRITQRKDANATTGAEVQTFVWDHPNAIGQLDRVSTTGDGGAYAHETRFSYDSLGRLSQRRDVYSGQSGNESLSFGYSYDGRGRPDTLRYPETSANDVYTHPSTGGLTLKYEYKNGQLSAIRDNARPATDPPIWQVETREGYGPPKTGRFAFPGGASSFTTWDRNPNTRRLGGRTMSLGNLSVSQWYTYYTNGELSGRDTPSATAPLRETFGYDGLKRLTSYERNGINATTQRISAKFAYDDVGNITGVDTLTSAGSPDWGPDDETYTISTSTPNFPATHKVGSATRTFVPDGMGRIQQVLSAAGTDRRYTYTTFDLPRTIELPPAGRTVTLAYTATGARARKTTTGGGSTTDVVYVSPLYEQHKTTSGSTVTGRSVFRIQGEDGMLAEIVHPWTASSAGTRVRSLFMNDQQGSPQHAANGSSITTLGLLPYGKRAGAPPASPSPAAVGYTGHIQDDDLGLINMNSRLYDISLRRFITRDPAVDNRFHVGGLNPYAYALGNPTNRVDPNGLASRGAEGAGGDDGDRNGTGTGPGGGGGSGDGGGGQGGAGGQGGGDQPMPEGDIDEVIITVDTSGRDIPANVGGPPASQGPTSIDQTAASQTGGAGPEGSQDRSFSLSPTNAANWAVGVTLDFTAQVWYGGSAGLNVQYTSDGGLGFYFYTPTFAPGTMEGFAFGPSLTINGAAGPGGDWTGMFSNIGASAVGVALGMFSSDPSTMNPGGGSGWAGFSVGVSAPGYALYTNQTNYSGGTVGELGGFVDRTVQSGTGVPASWW